MSSRFAPRVVWVLGCVSFLTACSSAMVYSVLPLFLVQELRASVVYLGLIEGIAESLNSFAKAASGALSDGLKRRKSFVLLGYALSALNKVTFPLAGEPITVLLARVIDRFGKGIRDAPRDALLADSIPVGGLGGGFGLRLAFYTAGYVVGPLTAMILLRLSAGGFRVVFWAAILPAVAGVLVLAWKLKESPPPWKASAVPLTLRGFARLPRAFWFVIAVASLFSLARVSNSFLVLKAHATGMTADQVPLMIIIIHFVYACLAYPFGALSDRIDRSVQLKAGALALGMAAFLLADTSSAWLMPLGAILWGVQLALTQGLFAALLAESASPELRGTAFGIYELLTGAATLLANVLAGVFWSDGGPSLVYSASSALASVAFLSIWIGWPEELRRRAETSA